PRVTGETTRISELVEQLGRFADAMQRARGLAPAQWEVLRYLGRANRYSRQPGALAAFLGTTKGTVSQTVIALERKGLIERTGNPRDRRSVHLTLTPAGQAMLNDDPLAEIAAAAATLRRATATNLATDLADLLLSLQRRAGRRSFGICATCRFFRRNAAEREAGGPHRCGLTQEPLGDADIVRICVEHETSAA
ncbi:MAG: MarR family transcriptional regulator, partial [Rhodospirillaceae bacterium]|nr:MarR family transcriptional regulator [Rhodospirillaceae bacterium]